MGDSFETTIASKQLTAERSHLKDPKGAALNCQGWLILQVDVV